MAYFGLSERFLVHSGAELNKGYEDLYLEPHTVRYPRTVCGYVIELKYLNRLCTWFRSREFATRC